MYFCVPYFGDNDSTTIPNFCKFNQQILNSITIIIQIFVNMKLVALVAILVYLTI